MAAGGPRHFTNAWVTLQVLRRLHGCTLPIQLWYLGPDEMSGRRWSSCCVRWTSSASTPCSVRRAASGASAGRLGVQAVRDHPQPIPRGALARRRQRAAGRSVVLFDGAGVCADCGAIFWPDLTSLPPEHPIWAICRVPWRDEPEFESGQMRAGQGALLGGLAAHHAPERVVGLLLPLRLRRQGDVSPGLADAGPAIRDARPPASEGDRLLVAGAGHGWRRLDAVPARSRPVARSSTTGPAPASGTCSARTSDSRGSRSTTSAWRPWPSCERAGTAGSARRPRQLSRPAPRPRSWRRRRSATFAAPLTSGRWSFRQTTRSAQGVSRRRALVAPGARTVPRRSAGHRGRLWRRSAAYASDADGVWRGRWLQFEQMPIELIPLG